METPKHSKLTRAAKHISLIRSNQRNPKCTTGAQVASEKLLSRCFFTRFRIDHRHFHRFFEYRPSPNILFPTRGRGQDGSDRRRLLDSPLGSFTRGFVNRGFPDKRNRNLVTSSATASCGGGRAVLATKKEVGGEGIKESEEPKPCLASALSRQPRPPHKPLISTLHFFRSLISTPIEGSTHQNGAAAQRLAGPPLFLVPEPKEGPVPQTSAKTAATRIPQKRIIERDILKLRRGSEVGCRSQALEG